MTIKLHSLARWQVLPAGGAVSFGFAGSQRYRINFNCAAPTVLYLEDADGPRFLASLPAGLETLEFFAAGPLAIFAQDGSGEVHYQTAETEPTHHEVVDPVVFTKIAQRRHRNPELEEMMYRMEQNLNRRLDAQRSEYEAAIKRMEKARVQTDEPPRPAPKTGSGKVSEPQPAEAEPSEDAGSEDEST